MQSNCNSSKVGASCTPRHGCWEMANISTLHFSTDHTQLCPLASFISVYRNVLSVGGKNLAVGGSGPSQFHHGGMGGPTCCPVSTSGKARGRNSKMWHRSEEWGKKCEKLQVLRGEEKERALFSITGTGPVIPLQAHVEATVKQVVPLQPREDSMLE